MKRTACLHLAVRQRAEDAPASGSDIKVWKRTTHIMLVCLLCFISSYFCIMF